MNIQQLISSLDRDITYHDKQRAIIQSKRDRLADLSVQYPKLKCENNVFCLPDIWGEVSCMRLERIRNGYSYSSINLVARFSVGARNLIGGMKIHTDPYNNLIAKVDFPFKGAKTIEIYDYDAMIPKECPNRTKFIKRIKGRIIQQITRGGLTITNNSYDRFGIEKLILLR